MFQLLTRISNAELFKFQLPVILAALLVAELFYKFGSFTLECLGFLATWFVVDAAASTIRRKFPITSSARGQD